MIEDTRHPHDVDERLTIVGESHKEMTREQGDERVTLDYRLIDHNESNDWLSKRLTQ